MGKLVLQPAPTFTAPVEIHVPGSPPAKVEFNFKHRTRAQLDLFLKALPEMSDVEMVLAMADGWDLADTFNEVNVVALVQSYIAAPAEICEAYLKALTGARAKN
jgi:hypothetical protein